MAVDKIIIDYKTNLGKLVDQQKQFAQGTSKADRALKNADISAKKFGNSAEKAGKKGKKGFKDSEKGVKNTGKAIKKTRGELTGFDKTLGALQTRIIAVFAVERIIRFGTRAIKELSKLAIESEGVINAFDRLNDPNLLDSLREQTRGTIDDFVLMKAAVKAENFRIPLNELGSLLEFARRKAADTGTSIEFLTNSIIDGIGRKSLRIIDNLQISVGEVQEEFKKTGDFAKAVANVVSNQSKKMGSAVETTKDSVARLNTEWSNLLLKISTATRPVIDDLSKDFGGLISDINTLIESSDKVFQRFADNFSEHGFDIVRSIREVSVETDSASSAQRKQVNVLNRFLAEVFSNQGRLSEELLGDISRAFDVFPARAISIANSVAEGNIDAIRAFGASARSEIRVSEKVFEQVFANINKTIVNATKAGEAPANNLENLEVRINSLSDTLRTLDIGSDAFSKTKKELETLQATYDSLTKSAEGATGASKKQTREALETASVLKRITNDITSLDFLAAITRRENIEAEQAKLEKSLRESGERIAEDIRKNNERITNETIEELNRRKEAQETALNSSIEVLANTQTILASQGSEFAQFQQGIALFQILIAQSVAIAEAIKNTASTSLTPIDFIARAASFIAAITGLFAGIISTAKSEQPPKFFGGTDWLKLNGAPEGKDTIPIMASEGEAIISKDENVKHREAVKALVHGYFDDYVLANHVLPALKKQEEETEKSFASNIANSFMLNNKFDDYRLFRTSKEHLNISKMTLVELMKISRNQDGLSRR